MGLQPIERDYTKPEIRAILRNPSVELTIGWEASAKLKPRKEYQALVYPVVVKYCKGLITLDEFKKIKIVPREVAKRIFEKLL